jgi:hypothetical protein
MPPTIAIIGASPDRSKFGNKAVRAYAQRGYHVYPIHPAAATIEGWPAFRSVRELPVTQLDKASLYVGPAIGLKVVEDLTHLPIGEVWLNPGADADEVVAKARSLGLTVITGCSIVAVGLHPEELD